MRWPFAGPNGGAKAQPPLTPFERLRAQRGTARVEAKGLTLRDARPPIDFFSPDGLRTIWRAFGDLDGGERVSAESAFTAAVYLFIALRWRYLKVSEAPLMVIEEEKSGPGKGTLTWLPEHSLAPVLDDPSPDLDGGELIALTQLYHDLTGRALWRKNLSRGGSVGQLTVFSGWEFRAEQTDDRMYGRFVLETAKGPITLEPEDVVFFRSLNPYSWHAGVSLVDVCLSWLNLGQQARTATYDVLRNALFPSMIVLADKDWNPGDDEYARWQQALESYADRDKRGAPLGLTGGGSASRVGLTMRDLIPGDILDRVESVVAAVSGVPAVVLQYQIGMENAPWSQMQEARRMAYEDAIEPQWRALERRITRQLLWAPVAPGRDPVDDDRTHMVRFDDSGVRALQEDRERGGRIAQLVVDVASVNERRRLVGLEPHAEPWADEIPGGPEELDVASTLNGAQITAALEVLTRLGTGVIADAAAVELLVAVGIERARAEAMVAAQPDVAEAVPAATGDGFDNPFAEGVEEDEAEEEVVAGRRRPFYVSAGRILRKRRRSITTVDIYLHFLWGTKQAVERWEDPITKELEQEKGAILDLFDLHFAGRKSAWQTKQAAEEFQEELWEWFSRRGVPHMRAVTYPLVLGTSAAGVRSAAAQIGTSFRVLQPGLLDYASAETIFLSDVMGRTTGEAVAKVVQEGLAAGDLIRDLRGRLEDLPEFTRQRAQLVARTETTRAWNGAQQRSLETYQETTGARIVKRWLSAGDDRVREEHAALESETADDGVPVEEPFSNGLIAPGEPNCRCTLTYQEVAPPVRKPVEPGAEPVAVTTPQTAMDATDSAVAAVLKEPPKTVTEFYKNIAAAYGGHPKANPIRIAVKELKGNLGEFAPAWNEAKGIMEDVVSISTEQGKLLKNLHHRLKNGLEISEQQRGALSTLLHELNHVRSKRIAAYDVAGALTGRIGKASYTPGIDLTEGMTEYLARRQVQKLTGSPPTLFLSYNQETRMVGEIANLVGDEAITRAYVAPVGSRAFEGWWATGDAAHRWNDLIGSIEGALSTERAAIFRAELGERRTLEDLVRSMRSALK